jgi:hypothetical protein
MILSISKFDLGKTFSTWALTMIGPKNQSAEWQIACYIRTKFRVDPIKNILKIRFSSSSWFSRILTLTVDLDYLV